jgi:hypothetical protein
LELRDLRDGVTGAQETLRVSLLALLRSWQANEQTSFYQGFSCGPAVALEWRKDNAQSGCDAKSGQDTGSGGARSEAARVLSSFLRSPSLPAQHVLPWPPPRLCGVWPTVFGRRTNAGARSDALLLSLTSTSPSPFLLSGHLHASGQHAHTLSGDSLSAADDLVHSTSAPPLHGRASAATVSHDFAVAAKALSPPARPCAQAIATQVQFFFDIVVVVVISVGFGGAGTEEGGKR